MGRRYDDPCGVARALDLIGERWALLVVRELLLGGKRFTDLRRGLPGISPNVLSQRLGELTDRGIVVQQRSGPPASVPIYRLTDLGAELEVVLLALGRWGGRTPMPTDAELSTDALWLALRATSVARRCPPGEYELTVDGDTVTAHVDTDELIIRRSTPDRPLATITTDTATLRAVVFGDRDLEDAVSTGALCVRGDHRAAASFVGIFERPTGSLPSMQLVAQAVDRGADLVGR